MSERKPISRDAISKVERDRLLNEPRQAEYRMREAYNKQPDSVIDADDWSTAEQYKP
jgi:hypothetical protein